MTSEQLIYRGGHTPPVVYHAYSYQLGSVSVLGQGDVGGIACQLRTNHDHDRLLLNPMAENRWFATDIDFKPTGATHRLVVKQKRRKPLATPTGQMTVVSSDLLWSRGS